MSQAIGSGGLRHLPFGTFQSGMNTVGGRCGHPSSVSRRSRRSSARSRARRPLATEGRLVRPACAGHALDDRDSLFKCRELVRSRSIKDRSRSRKPDAVLHTGAEQLEEGFGGVVGCRCESPCAFIEHPTTKLEYLCPDGFVCEPASRRLRAQLRGLGRGRQRSPSGERGNERGVPPPKWGVSGQFVDLRSDRLRSAALRLGG